MRDFSWEPQFPCNLNGKAVALPAKTIAKITRHSKNSKSTFYLTIFLLQRLKPDRIAVQKTDNRYLSGYKKG